MASATSRSVEPGAVISLLQHFGGVLGPQDVGRDAPRQRAACGLGVRALGWRCRFDGGGALGGGRQRCVEPAELIAESKGELGQLAVVELCVLGVHDQALAHRAVWVAGEHGNDAVAFGNDHLLGAQRRPLSGVAAAPVIDGLGELPKQVGDVVGAPLLRRQAVFAVAGIAVRLVVACDDFSAARNPAHPVHAACAAVAWQPDHAGAATEGALMAVAGVVDTNGTLVVPLVSHAAARGECTLLGIREAGLSGHLSDLAPGLGLGSLSTLWAWHSPAR